MDTLQRRALEKQRKLEEQIRQEQESTYQMVLSHLLEEGFASSEESADKIILNMSEAWFADIVEGRKEDAEKSLEAVKKRQEVLDAHEKKTGKKLDITKTPEHKEHKRNFPGAKRTGKKVKGAKETPSEKHSREVQTYTDRLKKYGKTKKQKRDDEAMSKHTSRYD